MKEVYIKIMVDEREGIDTFGRKVQAAVMEMYLCGAEIRDGKEYLLFRRDPVVEECSMAFDPVEASMSKVDVRYKTIRECIEKVLSPVIGRLTSL